MQSFQPDEDAAVAEDGDALGVALGLPPPPPLRASLATKGQLNVRQGPDRPLHLPQPATMKIPADAAANLHLRPRPVRRAAATTATTATTTAIENATSKTVTTVNLTGANATRTVAAHLLPLGGARCLRAHNPDLQTTQLHARRSGASVMNDISSCNCKTIE